MLNGRPRGIYPFRAIKRIFGRDAWRDRAVALLRSIGLDAGADVASDPFFGRSGKLLSRSQKAQALKDSTLNKS